MRLNPFVIRAMVEPPQLLKNIYLSMNYKVVLGDRFGLFQLALKNPFGGAF